MDALIKNLLAAFKVGIDELEWMSPETKLQAQDKLAKFRVKIAYPDQWRDYSALEVKPGDLVGNLHALPRVPDGEIVVAARQAGRALALGLHAADGQRVLQRRPTTRSRSRPASCSRRSSTSTPTMRSTTARSAR